MRAELRVIALALGVCAMLAAPTSASHQAAPQDAVARFAGAHLSGHSVLALLLLLASEEEAEIHAQLQVLYEAGYVSTAPGPGDPINRYLAAVFAARYKADVPVDVFALMLEYLKMVAREAREDRRATQCGLTAATVRVASRLPRHRIDLFSHAIGDWLEFQRAALLGLKESELEMLQLQHLISARQRAISLTVNMIVALNAATQQIAANISDGGRQPPNSQGSTIDQSGEESTGGGGGGCSISDSCP